MFKLGFSSKKINEKDLISLKKIGLKRFSFLTKLAFILKRKISSLANFLQILKINISIIDNSISTKIYYSLNLLRVI